MTNGEKLKEIFPNIIKYGNILIDDTWWNAEYKEPTTKNCESCRHYGSHHEVCKYCYKCSLWTQGEPTTKNNLGVDCVSRAYLLDDSKYHTVFNDDTGNFEDVVYREDIEKAPSVTPQPKIGHWIPTYGNVKCSVCGSVKDSRNVGKSTHYCDFCGAKMEGEKE